MGEQNHSLQIDFLRHGHCQGGDIFRGRTNVSLSDKGLSQMQAAIIQNSDSWSAIYSSPLDRCSGFAKSLASQLEIPLTVMADLQEISFGDWDGREIAQVWREQQLDLQRWRSDPALYCPPNGEAFDQFKLRINSALNEILNQSQSHNQYPSQRVLVICHGGVIRTLFHCLLDLPSASIYKLDIPYACLTRFSYFFGSSPQWQLNYHRPTTE